MRTIDDIRHSNLLDLISKYGGQRQLADTIGKAPAQISQWVTRAPNHRTGTPRVIGTASARDIETRCGLPEGWLDQERASDFVVVKSLGETAPPSYVEEVLVRFYPGLSASAGPGFINESNQSPLGLKFRAESLRRKGIDPATAFVVYARGDSMEPLIYDGDSILLDASKTTVKDGCLYVVEVDEDTLVKRLHRRPGNRLLVQSENQSYPPYEVAMDQPGFRIAGEVLWRAGWV
jgi:SOS-response transcriptional repressor LexA